MRCAKENNDMPMTNYHATYTKVNIKAQFIARLIYASSIIITIFFISLEDHFSWPSCIALS